MRMAIMITAPPGMAMPMDNRALFHLMSWMSPSYPVGAYTYSHGIEYAVEVGKVGDVAALVDWITDILEHGGGKSDAILLAGAYRATSDGDMEALREVAEMGAAFSPTSELSLETTAQGRAFAEVISNVTPPPTLAALKQVWDGPLVHPLVVGIAASDHDIPLAETLTAYLHGFAANLVSSAVRIVPLGQTDGQRAIAALAPTVDAVAEQAIMSSLGDLGTATMMVDWCSSLHETQYTRLFRS